MQLECEPIDSSPIEVDLCTQDAVDRLLSYAGGEVFVPSITAEAVMVTFSPFAPFNTSFPITSGQQGI